MSEPDNQIMRATAVTLPRPDQMRLSTDSREAVLLRQVAAGDRPAFESLYSEYFGRLSRFLGRLTTRREVIEEAVNDTFWIVWQKAGKFRGSSLVSTWIIGIAYRCGLKALRRNAVATGAPLAAAEVPGHEPALAEEREDWVSQGLAHLPIEQRSTLELAYYLGHSCQEIAQIMDCSVGTVKARMFHARVKLRNLLPTLAGSVPKDLS
jgi:RNA polymerase sigma-70 factor, ECF subfamily